MVKRFNITLEPTVAEELEHISKELGEKKSKLIEKALILYFEHLDIKVAEERLKRFEEGKTYTVPAEEVYRLLNIKTTQSV
jgi:predicted DNA-binding protein